jgi:hypothetical protein
MLSIEYEEILNIINQNEIFFIYEAVPECFEELGKNIKINLLN